ncbi:hypothetical protein LCGC14_1647360 [marine sediment metagenome]|uniref:AbiEi antitoxin C-terminal domain-containing protein n=1 Tax=marine sediment metagenome TaxID=412755 RepID=A0A0F9HXU4_9ZZZZ
MRPTSLQKARFKIKAAVGRLKPDVVTYTDLATMLSRNRARWDLANRLSVSDFLSFVCSNAPLRKVTLKFPHRTETRYIWDDTSVYQLAMSLRHNGYFSHHTAMSLHDLTDQLPKTIYINFEQSPKRWAGSDLEQSRIDLAFKRKPRVSRCVATYNNYQLRVLSGMYTGEMGVSDLEDSQGFPIRVTSIERTLIDIAVRPFYAGGVFEVLDAYRRAKPFVDIEKLVGMLRRLEYRYPFHQAIGCYMDKAGVYSKNDIAMLREFGFDFDFYLTYQMSKPVYLEKWRLFVPHGF